MMTIKACPNPVCEYHKEGKKDRFYSKWGYFKPRWSNKPVPRYRCNACGKSIGDAVLFFSLGAEREFLGSGERAFFIGHVVYVVLEIPHTCAYVLVGVD